MDNIILEIKENKKYIRVLNYNPRFITISNSIIKSKIKRFNVNRTSRFPQIQKRRIGLLFG